MRSNPRWKSCNLWIDCTFVWQAEKCETGRICVENGTCWKFCASSSGSKFKRNHMLEEAERLCQMMEKRANKEGMGNEDCYSSSPFTSSKGKFQMKLEYFFCLQSAFKSTSSF